MKHFVEIALRFVRHLPEHPYPSDHPWLLRHDASHHAS